MPDVALDYNRNPVTHLSNLNRKRREDNSMTETRKYLNSTNGFVTLGYHRVWTKVYSLNLSSKFKRRKMCPCERQGSVEVCTSGRGIIGPSPRPIIGCTPSSARSKRDEGTNEGPKLCPYVYVYDRGWPKSREEYGHGVPIVVKLVNGQITAKGNRSFDLKQKGGTADA